MQVNQSFLTLVPLSLLHAATRQTFCLSFLPSCKGTQSLLTHKPPCTPPWLGEGEGGGKKQNKKKNPVLGLPNQPEAQNRGSDYIQGSAECCWSQFASSSVIPFPSSRTRGVQNRQMHYAVFVRVRACRLQAADSQTRKPATSPLPWSLPKSLCPLSLLPPPPLSFRRSSTLCSMSPLSSPAASSRKAFFFFFATATKDGAASGCRGAEWTIAVSPQSTGMVLFLSDLRLPQTGLSRFRSAGIRLLRSSTASETHTGRSAVPASYQPSLQGFFGFFFTT